MVLLTHKSFTYASCLSHHLHFKNQNLSLSLFFMKKKIVFLIGCDRQNPHLINLNYHYTFTQIICHVSHCLNAQPSSGKWGYNLHLGININFGFFFLNGTYKKKKKKMISTQLTFDIRNQTHYQLRSCSPTWHQNLKDVIKQIVTLVPYKKVAVFTIIILHSIL